MSKFLTAAKWNIVRGAVNLAYLHVFPMVVRMPYWPWDCLGLSRVAGVPLEDDPSLSRRDCCLLFSVAAEVEPELMLCGIEVFAPVIPCCPVAF